jgi:hypothetical protein
MLSPTSSKLIPLPAGNSMLEEPGFWERLNKAIQLFRRRSVDLKLWYPRTNQLYVCIFIISVFRFSSVSCRLPMVFILLDFM